MASIQVASARFASVRIVAERLGSYRFSRACAWQERLSGSGADGGAERVGISFVRQASCPQLLKISCHWTRTPPQTPCPCSGSDLLSPVPSSITPFKTGEIMKKMIRTWLPLSRYKFVCGKCHYVWHSSDSGDDRCSRCGTRGNIGRPA